MRTPSLTIKMIGVGEAFDPALGTCSFLVKGGPTLLIDCGYGTPFFLFQELSNGNELEAVYLTHFHADHYFGLPILLGELEDLGRTSPLTILGQKGLATKVIDLCEMAYPGMFKALPYPVIFEEFTDSTSFRDLTLRTALSSHSVPNYAISVERNGVKAGFSGDGALTPASKQLLSECSVVLHECFVPRNASTNHAAAADLFQAFQDTPGSIKRLYLVHLQKGLRTKESASFLPAEPLPFEVAIPNQGEVISVE